jgi:hypothetical protein
MTRISFWYPAENHERFAPHAFDGAIGKQVPMKSPALEDMGMYTLVAADVAEDGSGVTLTIEAPGSVGPVTSLPAGTMSFAFREPEPDVVLYDPLNVKPPRIKWKT